MVAPLAGSVDRNMRGGRPCAVLHESLPSRGAWIEIRPAFAWLAGARVAPLAGSVDRNVAPCNRERG